MRSAHASSSAHPWTRSWSSPLPPRARTGREGERPGPGHPELDHVRRGGRVRRERAAGQLVLLERGAVLGRLEPPPALVAVERAVAERAADGEGRRDRAVEELGPRPDRGL